MAATSRAALPRHEALARLAEPGAALDVRARLAALLREAADLVEAWPALNDTRDIQRYDRALRLKDYCQRMGMTYSYAVKHWRKLPGAFKDVDGRVKVHASKLLALPSRPRLS